MHPNDGLPRDLERISSQVDDTDVERFLLLVLICISVVGRLLVPDPSQGLDRQKEG